MPRLTHFSFDENVGNVDFCRNALFHCKFLKVFALFFSAERFVELFVNEYTKFMIQSPLARDPRFVILLRPDDFRVEWEQGARGGVDDWARTDELVRKRRSGELTSECFAMVLDDFPDSSSPRVFLWTL